MPPLKKDSFRETAHWAVFQAIFRNLRLKENGI